MSKNKTVVLLVEHTEFNAYGDSGHRVSQVVESVEVGKKEHWKTPSEFIKEFAKLYAECNRSENHRFTITNVIIN